MNLDDELKRIPASLCIRCKGSKLLCGKSSCPIVTKIYLSREIPYDLKEVAGSSPPSVFIGHYGYPKVRIGPAVPPVNEGTEIYERPDMWLNLSIDQIAEMRFSLYRGYKILPVARASDPNNYLLELHDLILSAKPVYTEMEFSKISGRIDISPESQPFGPGGYVREFYHENSSSIPSIERLYYDTDVKGAEAVLLLYPGTSIYSIEKAFSAGMLGKTRSRRIVPTRWSITAVDKIISDALLSQIMDFDRIDGYITFHFRNIGNEYYVLVMPGEYSFEVMEIWNNGSIWAGPRRMTVESDYEKIGKMVSEPKIGGSFFASKVAVLEYLRKRERKGQIIVVRFIDGEYTIPLGVWQVRENLRAAMLNVRYIDGIDGFFGNIREKRGIDISGRSKTLQIFKQQKMITDYR